MIIIQIAGRLGKDPESRFTPSGLKVTTITVATNVRKGGKDETVWWRVTIWGDRFDKMMQYLKKGSAVVVVGEMNKPEIWTDKEGRPQVSLELTAEIIRFSPFGNPEKSDSSKSEHGTASQTAGHGGFPDSDFGASPAASSIHGSASGYSFGHGMMHNSHQSEDPLPF